MNTRMDNWAEQAERRFNEQQQAIIAENDARRRLRDAAPKLLAALIELDAWAMNESGAHYPNGTFEIVRSVIAEATGETC
jgi:hypothetical protein